MGKLYVKNMEQKIIFLTEMKGQISDGQWENARPYNHYKFWCNIKADDVIVDINKQGFIKENGDDQVLKNNYVFASKSLLDIVGDRIILMVNIYKKLGNSVLPTIFYGSLSGIDNLNDYLYYKNINESYYINKIKALTDAGITAEVIQDAIDNPEYRLRDLIKDCKELSVSFKTDLTYSTVQTHKENEISVKDLDAFVD